ncbi:hypothetical protein M422DRAFT_75069 [Sphaerobolus stellatus SS14]|uniref:Kinesin-like protein n=1 Tax=Sphaerobolus stellatus (strain SS14) TaxID=990650 RepID=A0A0C9W243_SPHS4|nr:hypothetical protein M422DRAFT_75069 [Sphaerobolus stellatus SS14]
MSSRTTKAAATPATRASTRARTPATRLLPARTTRAVSKTQPKDADVPPSTTATPARKPLYTRDNVFETPATAKKTGIPKPRAKTTKAVVENSEESDRQPIKAFLRIRPHLSEEPTSTPYLTALSETVVQMTDPSPSTSRLRPTSSKTTYTFSQVFPPDTQQAEFFTDTALPLVRDFLGGQSGLLFAYGVTNSGKTYTIQGGNGKGEGGLLPKTLDVVFNSIEGLHSEAPLRPVRLTAVEYDHDGTFSARSSLDALGAAQKPINLSPEIDQSILARVMAEQIDPSDKDDTILKVDKNYEYSVWVSYAEIYNEKVFDLLGIEEQPTVGGKIRPSGFSNFSLLASSATADHNNPLLVKRKALALKNDPDGGKYIAGLREVRIRNAEEGKAVLKMGLINRTVFGTLANRASSRSHGIFTLKLIKVHKGDPDDVGIARLSIVDLAGSERANNTQNTGERLKEAGSINKSLMVLGQCMETLRMNQRKLAMSPLAAPGAIRPAHVPFRHSKLTELFQDFFEGSGKAVMIVNVNPYDTGFDENSHVMKFASLAREVTTVVKKLPPPSSIPRLAPNANHRRVTIEIGGKGGTRVTETHLDVVEEDEEADEDDTEGEPRNTLVDALFEQIEELRMKLFEAEIRCAIIESDTREEVMTEMEDRMSRMERMFTKRLMTERISDSRPSSPDSPLQKKVSIKSVVRASFDSLLSEEADDSIVIIPNKQSRKDAMKYAGPDAVYIPRPGEVDEVPKKKKRVRILGKKAIVTEEEIDAVTNRVAAVGLDESKLGSVRRLGTRPSKRSS